MNLKFLMKTMLSMIIFFPHISLSMLINSVPNDIWKSIFSQLSNKDLCSYRLVSHEFNKTAPIILPDGSLSFVPTEKELSNLVKYALLNNKKDMLNALAPHAKKIPFEYKWASGFTYDWNRSPEKAVLSFETLNSTNYDDIVSKLSSKDKESFLLPIIIDQESVEHLTPLIKCKQKYPRWFNHNMELALWADKPKVFHFLSEHFPIIPINPYRYPLHLRAAVWKAKAYFKQENEIDASAILQEAGFTKQFIGCLVFKTKKFDASKKMNITVPSIIVNGFDAYLSQISQNIRSFDQEISDYLSRIPQLLYPNQKESYMAALSEKNNTNTLTLEYLITFLNKELEEIIQEAMQHFVYCIGIVRRPNKVGKLMSIDHTTFWLKEFLRRKKWESSAKIFNLCNNFEQTIIEPLYDALKKNDITTLRSLLTHIEAVQHYFSCKDSNIMWIHHILLLYEAIKLHRSEAFFFLYALHLHYNDTCTQCTNESFKHNKRKDDVWEMFYKLNKLKVFPLSTRYIRHHVPYILFAGGFIFLLLISVALFHEISKDQL